MEADDKFGFVVMDGNGCLFGTLSGNTRNVLHKFSVELPKKHGRGGQSALRFARLRLEKRHNYVRKVAEACVTNFISDNAVNVVGLVLAGSADFKTVLAGSELFDGRLKDKILCTVDVSYGGENGFNQAIELSQEILGNVKFVQEKKLIQRYFDEIAMDSGKYVFGVQDTLSALEQGAVSELLVFEDLDVQKYDLVNSSTNEESTVYLNPEQAADHKNFVDAVTGSELEIKNKEPLVEWFAREYKKFGAKLEYVSDKSEEGTQFATGFNGIGGFLRWAVEFDDGIEEWNDEEASEDDDDYDDMF